jgi:hypothetical protein
VVFKGGTRGLWERQNSEPSEGNVLETIDPRRYVLLIGKLRLRSGALADAAHAIERGNVSESG